MRFDLAIREAGCIPIAARSLMRASSRPPEQRNTDAEKKAVEEGRIPEDWNDNPKAESWRPPITATFSALGRPADADGAGSP